MSSTAALITEFVDDVASRLPNGHTGAGDPSRRARKVINDEMVEVWIIGHSAETTEVTLPYRTGTLPLTVADAAALVDDA